MRRLESFIVVLLKVPGLGFWPNPGVICLMALVVAAFWFIFPLLGETDMFLHDFTHVRNNLSKLTSSHFEAQPDGLLICLFFDKRLELLNADLTSHGNGLGQGNGTMRFAKFRKVRKRAETA